MDVRKNIPLQSVLLATKESIENDECLYQVLGGIIDSDAMKRSIFEECESGWFE